MTINKSNLRCNLKRTMKRMEPRHRPKKMVNNHNLELPNNQWPWRAKTVQLTSREQLRRCKLCSNS